MPHILITADAPGQHQAEVLLDERINMPDLESDHFSAQLLERIGWTLVDAEERERA